MATLYTFNGKIKLKKDSKWYPVSVEAKNVFDAKKLIEAQYGAKFDRWAQQPRRV